MTADHPTSSELARFAKQASGPYTVGGVLPDGQILPDDDASDDDMSD